MRRDTLSREFLSEHPVGFGREINPAKIILMTRKDTGIFQIAFAF
jgi:hypothetical protein